MRSSKASQRLNSSAEGDILSRDCVEVKQARIDKKIAARQQAEAAEIDQERRLIEAETAKKVAEEAAAQLLIAARAEANEIRSEALTPQVLQSQYYDALANADTLIVTGTDTPVILDAATATTTGSAPTDDQ